MPQTGLLRQVSAFSSSIFPPAMLLLLWLDALRVFCCGFQSLASGSPRMRDAVPLAAVHTLAPPLSFGGGRGGGCLPCCGAACFPACLPQPQTRDTKREGRDWGGGREGGSAASLSLPPSLALLTFEPVSPPPLLLLYFLSSPAL